MPLPLLAITLGDPSGVGPEIILKALRHPEVFQVCRPLIVGDARILRRAAEWLNTYDSVFPLVFERVADPASGLYNPGSISLLDLSNADPTACRVGRVCPCSGQAAVEYVFAACDLALAGKVDGIVTAPLNKEAMNLAGFHYAGHTELLTERTHAQKVSMLLISAALRVVHVSTHVSLEEAIRRVTRVRVGEVIDLAQAACVALGILQPRIAVAGLNPHASEEGLFGTQEAAEIIPAVNAARARGLQVSGPLPPDTVFMRAAQGEFDIVVAMYHDQGHIPMKLLAFDQGVNVSLGLPVIRTSVDHGTAFDIAGTGQARETSLLAAIHAAVQMVHARKSAHP